MMRRLKRNEYRNTILCPGCLEVKPATRHHCLPCRHFENSPILHLCDECHRQIEKLIPMELQPDGFYLEICKLFLKSRR